MKRPAAILSSLRRSRRLARGEWRRVGRTYCLTTALNSVRRGWLNGAGATFCLPAHQGWLALFAKPFPPCCCCLPAVATCSKSRTSRSSASSVKTLRASCHAAWGPRARCQLSRHPLRQPQEQQGKAGRRQLRQLCTAQQLPGRQARPLRVVQSSRRPRPRLTPPRSLPSIHLQSPSTSMSTQRSSSQSSSRQQQQQEQPPQQRQRPRHLQQQLGQRPRQSPRPRLAPPPLHRQSLRAHRHPASSLALQLVVGRQVWALSSRDLPARCAAPCSPASPCQTCAPTSAACQEGMAATWMVAARTHPAPSATAALGGGERRAGSVVAQPLNGGAMGGTTREGRGCGQGRAARRRRHQRVLAGRRACRQATACLRAASCGAWRVFMLLEHGGCPSLPAV